MLTLLIIVGLVLAPSVVFVELVRRGRATQSMAQIRADLETRPTRS